MNLLNKEGGSILLTNYFHSSTNYLAFKGWFLFDVSVFWR